MHMNCFVGSLKRRFVDESIAIFDNFEHRLFFVFWRKNITRISYKTRTSMNDSKPKKKHGKRWSSFAEVSKWKTIAGLSIN